MSAFVIVELKVTNAEKLQQYSQQAAKTIETFAGEFIAKGRAEPLTATTVESSYAIIRFESKEAAESWYLSEAYQALIPLRDQAMDCTFRLVEGL